MAMLALLAQTAPEGLSLNVIIALVSTLVGAAITYGAMRATIAQLQGDVKKLGESVEKLTGVVNALETRVTVLQALDARREPTGRHTAVVP